MKIRKDALFHWLVGLVILAITAIIYIIQHEVFYVTDNAFSGYLTRTGQSTPNTWIYLKLAEDNWPIVIVLGVIIMWLSAAQKREYDTGIYS